MTVKATFWRQATSGTSYWRTQVPARYLPGKVCDLTPKDLQEDTDGNIVFPRQEGAAIWQFSGNTTRGLMMAGMHEQGIPVLMEVDDNYLIESEAGKAGIANHWTHTIEESVETGAHSFEAHGKLARWVDGMIVASHGLEEAYRKINPRVFVCPNALARDDWPEPDKPDDGVLRIVWAGSASHVNDAHVIRRAFDWAAKQDGVEAWVFGVRSVQFDRRIQRAPWTDSLTEYRRNLQMFDVGVCPLVETRWARCKSHVKALEYAASGVYPVVQKGIVYADYQGPCIRAGTSGDWERAVRWCVIHRDEIRELGKQAREYVLAEHEMSGHIHKWAEAIDASSRAHTDQRQARLHEALFQHA